MPIEKSKIEKLTSRSDYFQDILDKVPPRLIWWGNSGMLLILVLLCIALNLIKYPDVITSEGLVTTQNPPVEIYSNTSGRITHFLKADGAAVKAGDLIMILNNNTRYSDIVKLKAAVEKIDSTHFWTTLNEIPLEELLSLGDLQDTYSDFLTSVKEFKTFMELNSHVQQLSINAERQKHLDSLSNHIQKEITIQERQRNLAQSDYNRNVKLRRDSVIADLDLEQKEIALLTMQNKVHELKATLINTQLQSKALSKENTDLKADRSNTYMALKNKVLKYYNNLISELSAWKNKYAIEAPVDGILNLYDIRNRDQYLVEQMKIFTIIPEKHTNYFALIKLPVANSGKVHVGQTCIIRLYNYPYAEFGTLRGNIESVSMAAKEGFYSVRVKLPNQLITNIGKQLDSKAELLGQADIVVEDLTVFERLFNSIINKTY